MPLQIIHDDITTLRVDAMVNSVSPQPVVGRGVDAAIHRAAGPSLLEERKRIGKIAVGDAVATGAGNLDARAVIHTAVPLWRDGSYGEYDGVRQCYASSLRTAVRNGCTSIAFPLLATGTYGFPRDQALAAAMEAIGQFLGECDIEVYLVVRDMDSFRLPRLLHRRLTDYLGANVTKRTASKHGGRRLCPVCADKLPRHARRCGTCGWEPPAPEEGPREGEGGDGLGREEAQGAPAPRHARQRSDNATQEEKVSEAAHAHEHLAVPLVNYGPTKIGDEGFADVVDRLMDEQGLDEAQLCRRANIDRKLLRRLRAGEEAPAKETALALAVALGLTLQEAVDLIGLAGYGLSRSSEADAIVQYFIEQGCCDALTVNEALFAFQHPQLGREQE